MPNNSNTIISFLIGLILSLAIIGIGAHRWQQQERNAIRQAAITTTTPEPPPTPKIEPSKPKSKPIETPEIVEDTSKKEEEEEIAELFQKKKAKRAKIAEQAANEFIAAMKRMEEEQAKILQKEEELAALKAAEIKAQKEEEQAKLKKEKELKAKEEAKAKALTEEQRRIEAAMGATKEPAKQEPKPAAPPTPIIAPSKPKVTTTTTFEDVKPELQQVPAKPSKITHIKQVRADNKVSFWDDFTDIKVYKSVARDMLIFSLCFAAAGMFMLAADPRVDRTKIERKDVRDMLGICFSWAYLAVPCLIYNDFQIFRKDPRDIEICFGCFAENERDSNEGQEASHCNFCKDPLSNWECCVCYNSLFDCKELISCCPRKEFRKTKNIHHICTDCFHGLNEKKCPLCRKKMYADNHKISWQTQISFGLVLGVFYLFPWVFICGFYLDVSNIKKLKVTVFLALSQLIALAISKGILLAKQRKYLALRKEEEED